MIVMNKSLFTRTLFSLSVALLLTACAEPYGTKLGPHTNHGYKFLKISTDEYWLTYEGTTRHSFEILEQYWAKKAGELCVNGFNVLKSKQVKMPFTLKTPVGGQTVSVGSWRPKVMGRIICKAREKVITEL